MKNQVFFGIAIRIVILFTIGFLGTFIPEQMRDVFGDTLHVCKPDYCNHGFSIDEEYDWGARHYWWFWMCILLFILSLVNVVTQSIKLVKKYHPEI